MDETKPTLLVTSSPHITSPVTVSKLMWAVVIALLPTFAGSIYFYGFKALFITVLSIASALLFDALGQRLFGRKITVFDGSAALTGLLLGFNLPPNVPWWIPVVGSAFATIVAKQFFGGLGHNFINPALAGRAFLVASWPTQMTTTWLAPRGGIIPALPPTAVNICTDAVTSATPLNVLKQGSKLVLPNCDPQLLYQQLESWSTLKRLFLGTTGGCIGETSALLLLIGGILLIATKVIDWRIPLCYLLTVAALALILPGHKAGLLNYILFHLLSGGLMLGAFYMATDYVTSPLTARGRIIFGIGCGVLTMLIRLWGGYPEGVCYSILLMNVATPLIDRLTPPRVFGTRSKK
jgi:electron transport complex protein RnfD|uniref:Ion-translocating oxidoreductase complex subunit D n=1 Tax=candidate division WOR-3 bacterium TaxID=2052148 RepID=A0A7V3V0E0_UNCW3